MFLDDLNTFFLRHSGVTGKVVDLVMTDNTREPAFFSAYRSGLDPLCRTLSIVTAPVCMALLAAEFFVGAIVFAFKSLFDVFIDGPQKAKKSATMACGCLLMLAVSIFASFLSPLINTLDMIGGGVNTVMEQCGVEESCLGCC